MRPAWLAVRRAAFRYVLHPGRWIYRQILKPQTYGARVLVTDPQTGAFLALRQSYGNRCTWWIPGGGYVPSRETAAAAAAREVLEETGTTTGPLHHLGTFRSRSMGNPDTVEIFQAAATGRSGHLSPEVLETKWIPLDDAHRHDLAPETLFALEKARECTGLTAGALQSPDGHGTQHL